MRVNTFWVDAIPADEGLYLLSIGDYAGCYVGGTLGKVSYVRRIGDTYLAEKTILDTLYRPASIGLADLNNDGTGELLVCSFGDAGGEFSLYQREENAIQFHPVPISTLDKNTGAMKCATHDFNHDGLKDIVLLVSDFDEHLSLFVNKGNGACDEEPIGRLACSKRCPDRWRARQERRRWCRKAVAAGVWLGNVPHAAQPRWTKSCDDDDGQMESSGLVHAVACVGFAAGRCGPVEKPDVVLVHIDDLSHYGVTAYGANRLRSSDGRRTFVTSRGCGDLISPGALSSD